ncbi:peroxidase-like [Physella acuta]|uniref:peroxidase-like n=1 Tax=Physella acuta TaxID=109671 RepID=UPI0027DAC351|nr:peroxidase-like [Physella acuta]
MCRRFCGVLVYKMFTKFVLVFTLTLELTISSDDHADTVGYFALSSTQAAMSTGSLRCHGQHFGHEAHRTQRLCYNVTSYKYRTYDGSCNNYKNYGAAFTAVPTLLEPEYADGIGSPRMYGVEGRPLPSARLVSLVAHPSESEMTNFTVMLMQWGQWVTHDLSAVPIATQFEGPIHCCGEDGKNPPFITNRHCFPIELPDTETYIRGRCMEFVRSIAATRGQGAKSKIRQQLNVITSFIDASQIYGSSTSQAYTLRNGGYLLRTAQGLTLPDSKLNNCIKRPNTKDYCLLAGDSRVNEHPGLGVMHTMWVREHNRIAGELRKLRSRDTDEDVFQLTRKIIIALQQIINYNEYLPKILGTDATRVNLVSKTGRTFYNPNLDPRVLSEFATAAFRFGHSTIPKSLCIGDRTLKMRELFHRPGECLENYDSIVASMVGADNKKCRQQLKKCDRNFAMDVTRFLFEPAKGPGKGLDLVALNIQRGRDHGVPPYYKLRRLCGLRPVMSFNDTEALGPHASDLGKVYRSVEDIDLFTGLLYEPVSRGDDAAVGPTLKCLIGAQFFNTKFGDRFFYDTYDQGIGFSDAQLTSLRNTSFSKIICHNTNLRSVQMDVFTLPSKNNPEYPCQNLKQESLDLSLFV